MDRNELIKKLTKTISKKFQKNILSIIQIGSFNRRFFSSFSDLDLIFIIKQPSEKLNIFLKKIFSEYQKPIDPSFIYLYKKKDPRILFGTHGYYMVEHLIQGKVLFGKNPFNKKRKTTPFSQIQEELCSKIKEYLYERKKWFLTKDTTDIKEQYKLAHRLSKAILDLLIINGTVSNYESSRLEISEIFEKSSLTYKWANFVYLKLKKIWHRKPLTEKELSKLIFILEIISYEASKKF